MAANNVSADLIWEISNKNCSYLHKPKMSGGHVFSRDPMNLINKHTRKYEGFVNDKAVGIQAGEKGGIVVTTKKPDTVNKPFLSTSTTTFASKTGSRRAYRSVASTVAKTGYRPDLREAAVQRVSALKQSQRQKKDAPVRKERGNKAKKAQAA